MAEDTDTVCGDEELEPRRPFNRPGLARLDYRIDTQPEFFARMKWRLPREQVSDPEASQLLEPLVPLRRRDTRDPTIALLDAFAVTLDTLSFYSERVANEGFIASAGQRRSLIELARMIGYEPAPGVAASVFLALEVESADDPYRAIEVPIGLQAMSVPKAKGELPQIFETVEAITARAEWNAMPVRVENDQNLALCRTEDGSGLESGTLYLFDLDNSFDPAQLDPTLLVQISDASALDAFYPVSPGLDLAAALQQLKDDAALNPEIVPELRALPVNEVFLRGTGLNLAKAARLAVVGVRFAADSTREVETAVLHVADARDERDRGLTRITVSKPHSSVGPIRYAPVRVAPQLKYVSLPAQQLAFDGANVDSFVRSASWTETSLNAFVRTQAWPREQLLSALRIAPPVIAPETSEPQPGLYVMRDDAAFFGASAPRQEMLAKAGESRGDDPYDAGWDGTNARNIWSDSQGDSLQSAGADVFLEREIKELLPDGWAVIEPGSGTPLVLRLASAKTQTRVDYAITGKSSGLLFKLPDNSEFTPPASDANFMTRTSKCFCVSQPLTLAGTPIREDLAAGDTTLDLGALYLDLWPGQAISIRGQRTDLDGLADSETLVTKDIWHIGGRTRLSLESGLTIPYRRTSVTLNANVAKATHGETQNEVLGAGDAAAINQRFKLAKPPLTYVSAANAEGRASTLEVRVDGVRWHELASLFEAAADEPAYAVRHEDDGTVWVVFGDGEHGRRLPTGTNNVSATYRSGIGHAGEVADESIVQLRTRPLGLRAITNPSAATGSAEPEPADLIRRNAPRTVRTLGRIVSLRDYQDFAETFPGIGKARVDVVWSGQRQVVYLSVGPETDSVFDPAAETLANLTQAIEDNRDLRAQLTVGQCTRRYFELAAKLQYHPDYLADLVLAALEALLLESFGYGARSIAQPVSAAEIIAACHRVPGVVGVDLDALSLSGSGDQTASATSLAAILPALPARPGTSADAAILPAELLTILPSGIDLTLELAHV